MSDDDGDWDANEGGGDGGDDGADGDFDGGKKKKSPKKPKKADAKKKEPKAKKEPKEKKAAASKRKSAGDGAPSPAVPDPKRQKIDGAPPGAVAAKAPAAAAGAAAPQGEPLSTAKAKPFLLDWVTKANRPYGYLQVWENTHRRVPKAAVTRILDELVQEQKLVSKAFNKNVLYMAVQDPNLVIDEKANDAMDAQINALTEQVAAERAVVTDIETKSSQLNSSPTDAEADALIAKLEKENAAQAERLRKLKGGHAEAFTQAQVDQVNRDFYNAFMKWKRFKKAVEQDMLNMWMDGAAKSKKPKKMLEDVGIETDEEVGVKLAAFEEMFSKIPPPGKGGKPANGAKASPPAAAPSPSKAAAPNGVSSPPLPIASGKSSAASAAAAAMDDDGDGDGAHANGGADGDESRAEMDAGDSGAAHPGDAPAASGDADEPVAVDD